MGRPRAPFPPVPKQKPGGSMRVWWLGQWWPLGSVDDPVAWKAEYARLCSIWAVDPHAQPQHTGEYLVVELCRDYLASADSPRPGHGRDRVKLAIKLLLEVHAGSTIEDFGPVALRTWQAWLCGLTNEAGEKRFNITTVNYHVGCVRRVWRWGVATERVSEHRVGAFTTVPPPKFGDTRPPRVVEPADHRVPSG